MQDKAQLLDELKRFGDLHECLSTDTTRCAKAILKDSDSEFWRRTAIRTFVSELEAKAYRFKQIAAAIAPFSNVTFSARESECISGTKKLTTFREIKFSISGFARSIHHDAEALLQQNEWHLLDRAIQLRHRLTHAKTPEDINIKDEEIAAFGSAVSWFGDIVIRLLAGALEYFQDTCTPQTIMRSEPKIGRNEQCPCGSGLKFKLCCAKNPNRDPVTD